MLKKLFTAYLLIFSFYFPIGVLAETSKEENIPSEIEKLRNLRRSQINIDVGRVSVKVYLFAEDEKMRILTGSYCGGEEGDMSYTGNYQLISVKDNKIVSRIDLGKDYNFIENTLHNGIDMFVMPKTLEQLIILYQYRSCNTENVEFYRVDMGGHLYKVNFLNKNGTIATEQTTGPTGDISGTNGDLTFCSYNNAIGYSFCDAYAYNGKDFIQTSSWMTQGGEKHFISQARLALFEYLSALSQADYKKAIFYYGGKYDLLIKLNPDVSPTNKPKLFERYCTKNGGNCLIPAYFSDKNLETPIELKFTIEFISRSDAIDYLTINGKKNFEFRVKRINGEFKVMDLPPYAPN